MKTVSRTAWAGREPRSKEPLVKEVLKGVALHYSASNADEQVSHSNCAARVRLIQDYHMDEKNWADIAYNFLVCKHGYVFTGRGWLVRSAAQGTVEGNDCWHAVCFLGDDTADRDDVTYLGRLALIQIIALAQEKFTIARQIEPHSHFNATDCPGAQLRAWIQQMREVL